MKLTGDVQFKDGAWEGDLTVSVSDAELAHALSGLPFIKNPKLRPGSLGMEAELPVVGKVALDLNLKATESG